MMEETKMHDQIQSAILSAIKEVNEILPPEMRLSNDPEAVIFGKGGKLDSLGLVNLVLAVEERLAERGWKVSLTDERAMSQNRSPFRSIEALTSFVAEATLTEEPA
jgi:acyl carrier protein